MPVGLLAASACEGSKFPKTVKAAVLPVLLSASRLSAGLPPPVAGLRDVKAKLVGVETRGPRDLRDASRARNTRGSAQQSAATDALSGVLVAAQAELLIVDRPEAFGSSVLRSKEGQPFEHLLALVDRGVRE